MGGMQMQKAFGEHMSGNDAVPVAPIPATMYKGWSNAYHLSNNELKVVVVPEIGRIAHLGWADEPNLLRLNELLWGETGKTVETDDWINFGGDWIWPVAQPHWPLFQDGNWPPSRLLDGRKWSGRAWRTEDGTQHSLMTEDFDPPISVRVHRTLRLPQEGARLTVRQRLERLEPSDIPVTLWQLSQIADADYMFIPVDEDSRFPGGLKPLLFEMPGTNILHRCGTIAVYQAGLGGEHKVGSDSPRRWIAALRGDTLILQRTEPGDGEGPYPDGGCTVEAYANTNAGYVEIESLSVEGHPEPGTYMDNTLIITLYRLDPDIPRTPCALADWVREIVGEDVTR